ncbi:MAG: hypothetical protein DWQ07_14210 [Chloroflexi bacterium]|nr:MAG: hypothetical protein DWQ07_14210 [Chloroflexota bacterium]MBL1195763.1 hypothetical protein [Chloroflexota bacterium]NOH13052.1 hypothetical protein [Chloroflexota bacterium]
MVIRYFPKKLDAELRDAGLSIVGCRDIDSADPQAVIDFDGTPSVADLTTAQAVLDSHDPTDHAALREEAAESNAAAIPNWSTWMEAEALAWHDTNIAGALPLANLSEANALLEKLENENRALVRLVLAIRNKVFPGLEGS